MAELYINHKNKVSHIEPEVYGHFSEHLGRCIYEGIYVGENSDIPNVNGMRKDVVEALKAIDIPVPAAALPTSTTGWMASDPRMNARR